MLQTHFSAIEAYRLLLAMPVKQRKEADITQHQLSCTLGRPQSFVSKYERGERRLDVIFLEFCRHLDTDAYEILKALAPPHRS